MDELLRDHPDWQNFWDDAIPVETEVAWRTRERDALPLLLKHMPRKGAILDAGCGRGGMLIHLFRQGFAIQGCDISEKNIALIRRAEPAVRVDLQDILGMSYPDGSFDAMLSYGVLQHMEDGPGRALREAHRVIKPGGLLFISVPYRNPVRFSLRRLRADPIVRRFLGKPPVPLHEEVDPMVGRFFTRREFEGFLAEAGFQPLEAVPLLCGHTLTQLSARFRGKAYPERPDYGTILDPPLSPLGRTVLGIAYRIRPWLLGYFQFHMARRR